MTGLMTRGWSRPAPPTKASRIAPSLLVVVENAMSLAWQVLLREVKAGRFSICDSHEDQITEELDRILGELHADSGCPVQGFTTFAPPQREPKIRDYRGKVLDRMPDLAFYPPRGSVDTTNSVFTGIFVECKPIDSGHPVPSTYCAKGIARFINGEYAWAVDVALMVGYVRNQCALPGGLNACLQDSTQKERYAFSGTLTAICTTQQGDEVYCSMHMRAFPLIGVTSQVGPISIHHLWLYPTDPCEQTRCRETKT